MKKKSVGQIVFSVFNYLILTFLALLCVLPVLHMLAISLSDKAFAEARLVGLWPKGFTFGAYEALFTGVNFLRAIWMSIKRTVLGTVINVFLTIVLAYPLSKTSRVFPGRTIYMVMCLILMVFSAGMVPSYLFVKNLGLFDTVWALVLPGSVPIFSVVLMMNFMRSLPVDMEEAATIDGANYFALLFRIVLPVSVPVIATVTLFAFVGHWNSWFDGLLYNLNMDHYPLQTYLQVVLTGKAPQNLNDAITQTGENLKAAQIFITMIPLLIVYPFAQRYFVSGIVVGAVKG